MISMVKTSIAPWLSVRKSSRAVEFYKAAFGATEEFRIESPDGNVVARLAIDGSPFWLSEESPEHLNFSPETLGGSTAKMVLTVDDPRATAAKAIEAGAREVTAVAEQHGWLVGRVVDPYGHHWEIGREV
jgi:PhnB protein